MVLNMLMVVLGLGGLFFGGELLVKSAARIARSLGVSSLVIGLTVVAWATSMPELIVNLNAMNQGSGGMALGNVVGSNIANIGLTLGLIGLWYTCAVQWTLTRREIPIMLLVSTIVFLLALDGSLGQLDGIFLVGMFLAYSVLVYALVRREQRKVTRALEEYELHEGLIEKQPEKISRAFEFGRLVVGLALLIGGANLMVDGASALARGFGVSELVIGMTVVAVGTSLPELAASIMAARQGQTDIAIGNLVGSNIANIGAVLGLTAVTQPVAVPPGLLSLEMPVMLAFSAVLLLFARDLSVRRLEGGLLIAAYAGFVLLAFVRT